MKGNIFIYGLIGKEFQNPDGSIEKGIDLVNVISQYQSQRDADEFCVHINSEGGYVDDGFDIYNFLKSIDKPVHTVAKGNCMSMATVIFMAGDTRSVSKDTKFMIHLPWGRSEGSAEEISDYAKQLKQVESKVLDFYSTNTGLSKEALIPLLKNETFLTPEQTVELGFSSEKWTTVEAVAKLNKTTKMEWINKLLNKQEGPKMLETTLADGNIITVETEADNPAVGDKVFDAEGNPVSDGEHVDKDGNILVVGTNEEGTTGVILEIKEPSEEGEDEQDESMAALEKLMNSFDERMAKMEAKMKASKEKDEKIKTLEEKFLALQKTVTSKKFKAPAKAENKGIRSEGDDTLEAKIAKQREAREKKK
ncbi:head maturation protease, ClpP-related [Mesonia sp. K4-1]|uniref:head maturation protease, ClpP-related n=1 Tax=Mesonia sp. K4-1 TaxID=2602760 RepID=UPI0011C933D8|nr:head maturation protease, ClpP-related [Mesonia sp. K4-1]TXK78688.1 Clp protease ClpP [Mesonia sp. K4-1]